MKIIKCEVVIIPKLQEEGKIDIAEFKFHGYLVEGERYKIDNSDKYFYHLFIYDPEYSTTKEHGMAAIEAKNLEEVKGELWKQLKGWRK